MLRRRLAQGLLLLIVASVVSFAFAALTPGGPFDELRFENNTSRERIASLEARYGLDQPLWKRYLRWTGSVLRGDLGRSLHFNEPVSELLGGRLLNTLLLTITATVIAWSVAILLGAAIASSRRAWVERLYEGSTSLLVALPNLLIALLVLFLAAPIGWFPSGGMTSLDFDSYSGLGQLLDIAHHLLLPTLVLVLGMLPALLRHVVTSVRESLAAPHVTAARARGLSARRVLWAHGVLGAANPLASLFGMSIASLASISLVVEKVLAWPGVGLLLLTSIDRRDTEVVVGVVLVSAVLLIVGNAIGDTLLWISDPRIRDSGATE